MEAETMTGVVRKGSRFRFAYLAAVLLAMLAASGCTLMEGVENYLSYNDSCDEAILNWRNHCWSWQAWRARQQLFVDQPQFYAFGEGFRAGYQDVASGGE